VTAVDFLNTYPMLNRLMKCYLQFKLDFLAQIKNYINNKWNSDTPVGSIFRNMALLTSGTGVAKAIGILTMPIITRIYLPEDIGVLSVFVALTAMLVPFGTLRYSMAIPLPKNDGLATNLVILCGISLFANSGLVFLIFWLFARPLLSLLSMDQLLPFWWLLPLAIAGTGMYELLTSWAVREKAFTPLAKTKVWQATIGSTVKIGLGVLGFKPLGLLIGHVFNQTGGVLSLLKVFLGKSAANFRHISGNRMIFLLKYYADFPKYRLPSQFLLIFATQAPLLYFAWQFGTQITGQLGLALMIVALPMTLFGQTTGQAYYAEIARIGRKNPDKIYEISKNITRKLFLISIPPFLILLLFGPWLFQVVFGDVWKEAGVFASILAIYLLTQFVSSPLVNALSVFDKQRLFLLVNVIRVVGIILVFGFSFGIGLTGFKTILVYSVALSVHFIFVAYLVFRVIKHAAIRHAV